MNPWSQLAARVRCLSHGARKAAGSKPTWRQPRRLSVNTLEDRIAPAVFTVNVSEDLEPIDFETGDVSNAPGLQLSLRAALFLADQNGSERDTIQFDVSRIVVGSGFGIGTSVELDGGDGLIVEGFLQIDPFNRLSATPVLINDVHFIDGLSASNATLTDSVIGLNEARDAAFPGAQGLRINNGNVTVRNTEIGIDQPGLTGGAVQIFKGVNTLLDNNRILFGTFDGIFAFEGGTADAPLVIRNNIIGGMPNAGISLSGINGVLANVLVENNRVGVTDSGAVVPNRVGIVTSDSAFDVSNVRITGNTIGNNTEAGITAVAPGGTDAIVIRENAVFGSPVGVSLIVSRSGLALENNVIGPRTEGEAPNGIGVRIESRNSINNSPGEVFTFGGPGVGQGNTIRGNTGHGLELIRAIGNFSNFSVQGNTIEANGGHGVKIEDGFGLVIGGPTAAHGNRIVGNQGTGIEISESRPEITGPVFLLANEIFNNGGLGIDHVRRTGTNNNSTEAFRGATPNGDRSEQDRIQNHPIITSVERGATTTTIRGTLSTSGNRSFLLAFYTSTSADPSGFGEGQRLIGTHEVFMPGSVLTVNFTATFNTTEVQVVTATAHQLLPEGEGPTFSHLGTSEFSPAFFETPLADLQIRTGAAGDTLVGAGVRETIPSEGQTKSMDVPAGFTGRYVVRVLNLHPVPKAFQLRTQADPGFLARLNGAATFTTPTLQPNAFVDVTLEVTPDDELADGTVGEVIVRVLDEGGTAVADVVRARNFVQLQVNTALDLEDLIDDGVIDSDPNVSGQQLSLRDAIKLANQAAGEQAITFDMPALAGKSISVTRALPTIDDPVIIDGSNPAGPGPILDGSLAPADVSGLVFRGGASGSIVKNLTVRNFSGHGIQSTASTINLQSVSIADNQGWGVHARGDVDIGFNLNINPSLIARNGLGGVLAFGTGGVNSTGGAVSLSSAEVIDNGGPGIVARDVVRISAIAGRPANRVSGNAATGITAQALDVQHFAGAAPSEFNDNGGHGLDIFGGIGVDELIPTGINVSGSAVITGNAGWGIRTGAGLTNMPFGLRTGSTLIVSNNGQGNQVLEIDPGEIGEDTPVFPVARQDQFPWGGILGGVGTAGVLGSALVQVEGLVASDNGGPGVAHFRGPVVLESATASSGIRVSNNQGPGVVTTQGIDVRIAGDAPPAEFTGNAGHGLEARGVLDENADSSPGISLSGPVTISGNAGWGILSRHDIINPFFGLPLQVAVDVSGNGQAAAFVEIVDREGKEVRAQVIPAAPEFPRGGVLVHQGGISLTNLSASNNAGPGVAARRSVDLDVVGTVPGVPLRFSDNIGPGIFSESDVVIRHLGSDSERPVVRGNAGDGIRGRSVTVLGAIDILDNAGWGAGTTVGLAAGNIVIGVVEDQVVPVRSTIRGNGAQPTVLEIGEFDGAIIRVEVVTPNGADTSGGVQSIRGEVILGNTTVNDNAGHEVAANTFINLRQVILDGTSAGTAALLPIDEGDRPVVMALAGEVTFTAKPNTTTGSPPGDLVLAFPVIEITVQPTAGGQAVVDFLDLPVHRGAQVQKFGPTADNPVPRWFDFSFDGQTGGQFLGSTLRVHLRDGQRGDTDLTANGLIVDPVAITYPREPDITLPAELSGVEGDPLVFEGTWEDVDTVGVQGLTAEIDFGDGTTAPIELRPDRKFTVSHTYADNGSFEAVVIIRDGDGLSAEQRAAVTVTNLAPQAGISGPEEATAGQPVAFTLSASDPSPVDQAAGFTFRIDWDGDGSVDQEVTGPSGVTVEHTFPLPGFFNIQVVAVDKDGTAGLPAIHAIDIDFGPTGNAPATAVLTDGILTITGTATNDRITINPGSRGTVIVLINNRRIGPFAGVERVLADGAEGDDLIRVNARLTLPTTLLGREGKDTLQGGAGPSLLRGDDGDDDLRAGTGAATLVGGAGNDTLTGGPADDLLRGQAGNDRLQGGPGNDRLDGGDGFDTVREVANVNYVLADSVLTGQGRDPLTGLEHADLTGASRANTFDVSGWTGSARLDGRGGRDEVIHAADTDVTLTNTQLTRDTGGPIQLVSIERAVLTGGPADNRLDASTVRFPVVLSGGPGNDTLIGGLANDTLLGEAGDDSLVGGRGNDRLDGGEGNDVLDGGPGRNTLIGGEGQNGVIVHGTDGHDQIRVALASPGRLRVTLNGRASLHDTTGCDTIFVYAGAGNDWVEMDPRLAARWDAELYGEAGDDILIGNDTNDLLDGGPGLNVRMLWIEELIQAAATGITGSVLRTWLSRMQPYHLGEPLPDSLAAFGSRKYPFLLAESYQRRLAAMITSTSTIRRFG